MRFGTTCRRLDQQSHGLYLVDNLCRDFLSVAPEKSRDCMIHKDELSDAIDRHIVIIISAPSSRVNPYQKISWKPNRII